MLAIQRPYYAPLIYRILSATVLIQYAFNINTMIFDFFIFRIHFFVLLINNPIHITTIN